MEWEEDYEKQKEHSNLIEKRQKYEDLESNSEEKLEGKVSLAANKEGTIRGLQHRNLCDAA